VERSGWRHGLHRQVLQAGRRVLQYVRTERGRYELDRQWAHEQDRVLLRCLGCEWGRGRSQLGRGPCPAQPAPQPCRRPHSHGRRRAGGPEVEQCALR
jgi:hypothetical protein